MKYLILIFVLGLFLIAGCESDYIYGLNNMTVVQTNINLTGDVNYIGDLIVCQNGTGTIITENQTLASEMGCNI